MSELLMMDQDADGNLVLIQGEQRIVLNSGQVNDMIDILLGPDKIKTMHVHMPENLFTKEPPKDPGPN